WVTNRSELPNVECKCRRLCLSSHVYSLLFPYRRFESFSLGFALLILCCNYVSAAADKSGVSPNSISLPKGPGSIEGLGESFQPSLNTGTAKYSIGLKLPPGVAGFAPSLSLSYEGGGGNGPLGFGWGLPTAFVQRRSDHGIPTYGEDV